MKKRKMNIAGKTGMAAVLFLTMLGMNTSGTMAMQDTGAAAPVIMQEAVWSADAEWRADVTWRVRGLHTYIAEKEAALSGQGMDIYSGSQAMSGTGGNASGEASGETYGETWGETSGEIPGESYDGMRESCTEESYDEESADSAEQLSPNMGKAPASDTEGTYNGVYSESREGAPAETYDSMSESNMTGMYGSEHAQEIPSGEMYEKMQEGSAAGAYIGVSANCTGESYGDAGIVIAGGIPRTFSLQTTGGYKAENMVYAVPASAYEGQSAVLAASAEYQEDIQMQPAFYVVDYVSEYFTVVQESLPVGCTAQQVSVTGQDGVQTNLTKLVWPIALPCADEITGTFQAELREGFRNPEQELTCPVSQEEPLEKDRPGAGLFLEEQWGGNVRTAAESAVCVLTAEPKMQDGAGLRLELKPSAEAIRAGESLTYTCRVENTGTQALSDITLQSSFSDQNTKAVWESNDYAQVNGKQAKIPSLAPGEGQTLYMTAVPGEGLSSGLTHTVVLEAFSTESQQLIRREAAGTVQVTPLRSAFEVEKTADRTTAVPGDTVTYQICIRNTGERTLHSVLSTERFLNANVQAQFLPKEGVTLNSTRTQALISEIAPGEAFALLASVTIPPYFTEQELVNEVTVISEETGTTSIQANATVQIVKQYASGTVTPTLSAYYKGAGTSGAAYASSSKPATGDRTEILLPIVLLVLSVLSGLKAYTSLRKR